MSSLLRASRLAYTNVMQAKLQQYFVLLPIAYMFVSIFLARSEVGYVYLAIAALIGLTFIAQQDTKLPKLTFLAQWMAVLGAIGISAAVILAIEKVELLAEPGHVASCSISPIVSCSPIIASPQASAFGFANAFVGIFGFTAVYTAAMTILAGASKLSNAWWRTLLGGISAGAGFCIWLIHEGIFEIGKLCLYCMLVWLVTFALFWLVASYCSEKGIIRFGKKLDAMLVYKYKLIIVTYLLVAMLIFYRWSSYWFSLF